nr:PilC/PilY family type IV pilus protein [Cupriavidus malaysiensis]
MIHRRAGLRSGAPTDSRCLPSAAMRHLFLIAFRLAAIAALAFSAASPAHAEDIDLYTGLQTGAGQPNILLVMDNAAAWDASVTIPSSAGCPSWTPSSAKDADFMACALYNALGAIGSNPALLGKIRLGLMMFAPASTGGGLFYYPNPSPVPPGPLPVMDSTAIANFQTLVRNNINVTAKASKNLLDESMAEAWAYFTGGTGISGTKYTSPLTDHCQKTFIIYIAGSFNNNAPKTANGTPPALAALQTAGATSAQQAQLVLPSNANKYQQNWGDEWARFMYQSDLSGGANTAYKQNVVTYTIDVTDGSNPSYDALVKSMSSNGGGSNFTVSVGDAKALQNALMSIFNEVQAVNSVFASVSLPASVNAQGQFLNQVYVGMFRPDASAAPRWLGNLKQYQIGYDANGNIVLQDAKGQKAISNASTGFISPNAVSFWTADPPPTYGASGYGTGSVANWPAQGYWQNSPSSAGWKLDLPDGEIVEKGGAGEMLRATNLTSQQGRTLLTCNASCQASTAFTFFDTSNSWLTGSAGLAAINAGEAGVPTITSTELPKLIAWMRGQDTNAADSTSIAGKEAEAGPGSPVTVRSSIHADVLHSRPAVVNYGSTGVVVYYGTNDGVFHAINGNQSAGINGVRPGGELWGFVAPDFFGKLGRLYVNSPEIQLSTTPGGITPTPLPRDYFFDGSTAVMQDLRNPSSPRVVIYLTARRGGRFLYAIDVTNPLSPSFLWRHSYADLPELGQTWSQPRVLRVRGYANPLVIMGAGYDSTEDSDPYNANASTGGDTMGRGLFAFDAVSGSLVWSALPDCTGMSGACVKVAGLTRAIPSDVTLLDRNGDGYSERLYVGDLGGNLWRADFEAAAGNAPANWTMTKLAALGGSAGSNNARKFFYPPDVVSTAGYDAVMIGSGDREHPLYSTSPTPGLAYNVVNRLYMIKDSNISGMPFAWTPITEAGLSDITTSTQPYSGAGSGFYITLTNPGEKAVNAALTVAGYTTIGTNTPTVPSPNQCFPNLGAARTYSFNFVTGAGQNTARSIVLDGGGFPPSAVFGIVPVTNGSSTTLVPVVIGGGSQTATGGGDATSPIGVQQVKIAGAGKRKRVYWYPESDRH